MRDASHTYVLVSCIHPSGVRNAYSRMETDAVEHLVAQMARPAIILPRSAERR
jgi:hypothetical protein